MCTHVHSPQLPPTQAATQHWEEITVLYSGFLVTHLKYSSVHMSFPNSLTILSPHPSPLAIINSFSKAMSLYLICK